MELKGTIKKIGNIETFASGFQKREFILLTEEQYPQAIAIQVLGNKIDIIDSFSEGESVKVGINIQGREWVSPQGETKYFNSIVAWKITRPESEQNNQQQAAQATTQSAVSDTPFEEEDDNLPF